MTRDKLICSDNMTASVASVVEQLNEEGIPDDDPVMFLEWVEQNVQIFLDRWQALEEVGLVQNPSFERPQSVAAFRRTILELICNDIPGATTGRRGGLTQCTTSVPFA